MAIGLYKPGQGYWVRVLTATLIGVLTLAAAAWMYRQMEVLADKLPRSVWVMPINAGGAPPVAGDAVTLYAKTADGTAGPEMGTATVEGFSAGANELRINNVRMKDPVTDPSQAGLLKVGAAQPVKIGGSVKGVTSVDPLLIQGVTLAVVLLLGAVLAYYFVAMHQKFVDFLIATDGEMKKVNWSNAKDIRKSTLVVIFASFLLAASLFLVDFTFQWFFKAIGILAS